MTPIPPYTPRGTSGGPSLPTFDIAYDAATNELIFTSDSDIMSDVSLVFLYGQSTPPGGPVEPAGYAAFGPGNVAWNVITPHEIRVPRAYEYAFSYNPGGSVEFTYGELWDDSFTGPAMVAKPTSPVVVDALVSADQVTVAYDGIGRDINIIGAGPVDFTNVSDLVFFSHDDGQIEVTTDYFMTLDTQTIQVLDPSLLTGKTFQALEIYDAPSGNILYTWLGTLTVPA